MVQGLCRQKTYTRNILTTEIILRKVVCGVCVRARTIALDAVSLLAVISTFIDLIDQAPAVSEFRELKIRLQNPYLISKALLT